MISYSNFHNFLDSNLRAEKRVRSGKAAARAAAEDELWKNMLRSDDTPKKASDKVPVSNIKIPWYILY